MITFKLDTSGWKKGLSRLKLDGVIKDALTRGGKAGVTLAARAMSEDLGVPVGQLKGKGKRPLFFKVKGDTLTIVAVDSSVPVANLHPRGTSARRHMPGGVNWSGAGGGVNPDAFRAQSPRTGKPGVFIRALGRGGPSFPLKEVRVSGVIATSFAKVTDAVAARALEVIRSRFAQQVARWKDTR